MNARERFNAICRFKPADRLYLWVMGIRGATRARWLNEGLPATTAPMSVAVDPHRYLGLDMEVDVPVNLARCPAFEEQTIEEDEDYRVWIDDHGTHRRDFKRTENPGFVTRQWLRFPVENRDDFLKMKKRYDPASPARYPDPWDPAIRWLRDTDCVVSWQPLGPFWTIREWMGFEGICRAFIDQPKLMHEMIEFVADFNIGLFERVLTRVHVDWLILSEDMAYKTASMISPAMFREFMLPHYLRMIECLRKHGVDNIFVDCDGNVDELIPLWLEAGVDGAYPIEIAAGCDPVEYRKRYPELLMIGGIDKRALARDRAAVKQEVMSKVPWLLERGGYIPGPDHAVPHDVPLDNMKYYVDLLREISGRT